jgi:single-strand DNA-binding protein
MNKSILMGRLVADPVMRYTATNNKAVASFTLAVDRRFKSDGQPTADFIPIICWTSTAEFVNKYFFKGMRVALVGAIQTRTWDDNEGKRHYVTEVIADEVYFADSKKDNKSNSNSTSPDKNITNEKPSYQEISNDNLPF